MIYADFEALTRKKEGRQSNPNPSNTQNTQVHEMCSYCYIVVRCNGKMYKPVEDRGVHTAENFVSKSLPFTPELKLVDHLKCHDQVNQLKGFVSIYNAKLTFLSI